MLGSPRQLAIASGLRVYDCGRACQRCGCTLRRTIKGGCVPCTKRQKAKQKRKRYLSRLKTDAVFREKHNARNRRTYKTDAYRAKDREYKRQRRLDPAVREHDNARDRISARIRRRTAVKPKIAVLREKVRKRIKDRLKRLGVETGRFIELVGCTNAEMRAHIERKFQPGMSWDNWSFEGWHLDHIIPLSAFDLTDPEQVKAASHYTNLQPLWGRDNIAKGSKLPDWFRQAA